MLDVEGERAKRRQGQRTDLLVNIVPISAPSETNGKAREIVAEQLARSSQRSSVLHIRKLRRLRRWYRRLTRWSRPATSAVLRSD